MKKVLKIYLLVLLLGLVRLQDPSINSSALNDSTKNESGLAKNEGDNIVNREGKAADIKQESVEKEQIKDSIDTKAVENIETSQPTTVIEEKKETQPVLNEDKKETQPVVNEDKKDIQPPVNEEKKETQPVVNEEKKETQPVVNEEKKETQPVVNEVKKETQPPVNEVKKETQPPVNEVKKVPNPPVEDEKRYTDPPVIQNRRKIQLNMVQDRQNLNSNSEEDQSGDKQNSENPMLNFFDDDNFGSLNEFNEFFRQVDEKKEYVFNNLPSDEKLIELNKRYRFTDQIMKYTTTGLIEGEFYYLNVTGSGSLQVSIMEVAGEWPIATFKVNGFKSTNNFLAPIDRNLLGTKSQGGLKIRAVGDGSDKISFILAKTSAFEMVFGDRMKVNAVMSSGVAIKVRDTKRSNSNQDTRVQFIVQAPVSRSRTAGGRMLRIRGNKGEKVPSGSKFDFEANGNSATGLLKTLTKSSNYYCFGVECVYSLWLETKRMENLSILPNSVPGDSTLALKDHFILLEQLEAGESLEYTANCETKGDIWQFSVRPLEGEVGYRVESKIKGEFFERVADGPERVVFGPGEADQGFRLKLWNPSSEAVVLRFEFLRAAKGQPVWVARNAKVRGKLARGISRGLGLSLLGISQQVVAVDIDFWVESGRADLFLKECNDFSCEKKGEEGSIALRTRVVDAGWDSLALRFICRQGTPNPKLPTGIKDSNSCIFALDAKNESEEPAEFTLRARAAGTSSQLEMRSLAVKEFDAKEIQTFSLALDHLPAEHDELTIEFFLLGGNVNITAAFSKATTNTAINGGHTVSASDMASDFMLESRSHSRLSPAMRRVLLSIPNPRPSELYITIQSKIRSVLEIMPSSAPTGHSEFAPEPLELGRLVSRGLSPLDTRRIGSEELRLKNFALEAPSDGRALLISLGSTWPLNLCVLAGPDFSFEAGCVAETRGGYLRLPSAVLATLGGSVIISVRQSLLASEAVEDAGFTLRAAAEESTTRMLLSRPGSAVSVPAAPRQRVEVSVSLRLAKRTARIFFSSDETPASVSAWGGVTYRTSMGPTASGLRVDDLSAFRHEHCETGECEITLAFDTADAPTRIFVAFAADDAPIELADGKSLPLTVDVPVVVLLPPYEGPDSLVVEASSQGKEFSIIIAPAESVDDDLTGVVDSMRRELLTSAGPGRSNRAIIEAGRIAKGTALLALLEPVDDGSNHRLKGEGEKDLVVVERNVGAKVVVTAHSKLRDLAPGRQVSGELSAGTFGHYSVELPYPRNFTIRLAIESGEADLYLNPGHSNFTSTDRYALASTQHRGDELVVDPTTFGGGVWFTLGVFARDHAIFSLALLFNSTLVKLVPQKMIEIELEPNVPVFLETIADSRVDCSMAYSEEGPVSIVVRRFPEAFDASDLADSDPKLWLANYFLEPGHAPLPALLPLRVNHGLLRLETRVQKARAVVVQFDATQPIDVLVERRFNFFIRGGQKRVLRASLKETVQRLDADFNTLSADLSVRLCPQVGCQAEAQHIGGYNHLGMSFAVHGTSKELRLFNSVYVEVEAKHDSHFSVFLRPAERFKELREYQTELINTDSSGPQYFFYYVSPKAVLTYRSLLFSIEAPVRFMNDPVFLFSPAESGTFEDPSTYLSPALIEYSSKESEGFFHWTIRPEIKPGYFIIRIEPENRRIPMKLTLVANNDQPLYPNGLTASNEPLGSVGRDTFGIYMPQPGKLRLSLFSCGRLEFKTANFTARSSYSRPLPLNAKSRTKFSFLIVNSRMRGLSELTMPVSEYVIDSPGTLKTTVGRGFMALRGSEDALSARLKNRRYFVNSEFKPDSQPSFISDYFETLHADWKKEESKLEVEKVPGTVTVSVQNRESPPSFVFSAAGVNGKIEFTSALPSLRPSLTTDYPELKYAFVRTHFVVSSQMNLEEKFERCGLSTIFEDEVMTQRDDQEIELSSLTSRQSLSSASATFNSTQVQELPDDGSFIVIVYMSFTLSSRSGQASSLMLDRKYTAMPFISITIKKSDLFPPAPATVAIDALKESSPFIIVVLLVVILFLVCRRKARTQSPYENPSIARPNVLEMSRN